MVDIQIIEVYPQKTLYMELLGFSPRNFTHISWKSRGDCANIALKDVVERGEWVWHQLLFNFSLILLLQHELLNSPQRTKCSIAKRPTPALCFLLPVPPMPSSCSAPSFTPQRGVSFYKSLPFTLIPLFSLHLLSCPVLSPHFALNLCIRPSCYPLHFLQPSTPSPPTPLLLLHALFLYLFFGEKGGVSYVVPFSVLVVHPREHEYSWLIH